MALVGIRVLELSGLAPAPFAGMILADFGAKVTRIDRVGQLIADQLSRGKQSISLNLKSAEGVKVFKKMSLAADVLIEPYRPGVMERMGLGPEILLKDNPKLIYARMSGFGQLGPLMKRAGHDINYISLSGVLSYFGRKGENPVPPVNIVGDFAGGGMPCAMGILIALLERTRSGKGQVIDANMVQGSAYVSSFLWATHNLGLAGNERGTNLLDTGAHFYDTYKTSDGKYMAVGALEPQFYQQLLEGLGLSDSDLPPQLDRENWSSSKKIFTKIFASKTQEEWCCVFDDTDACVTPVLTPEGAAQHSHNKKVGTFFEAEDGSTQPSPAPVLSRTPATLRTTKQTNIGNDTTAVLLEAGFSQKEIEVLKEKGVVEDKGQTSKL
ncbi:alpha-methylacyl-CoA racemase-like [Asterias rubens]|uniref:alpha-methylacyl-CoA racemase-like n=1 Tax=Asterias rubens TaxID=7604 RepID=UPI0014551A73|nr:alpha-methylacyl-CoA racemase-like [Asterias rubens]XP_033634611.1 alpha-methylacyl-CoA racemase-like [Asterias rubens]XP_033634612.1 alpha-methylacyl-CoA racemase-like [Asterias rubens]XP_033634613.1 alpha-methylacyl-CoA racemase-like [Asterias rubens]